MFRMRGKITTLLRCSVKAGHSVCVIKRKERKTKRLGRRRKTHGYGFLVTRSFKTKSHHEPTNILLVGMILLERSEEFVAAKR